MGTRGHYVFYFRGRYYVYYNHLDSYPEGLGQWILDSIPTDPEKYKEWLDSLRAWFQKYDRLLEDDLLAFEDDDEEPWHQKVQQRLKCPPPSQCPAPPPGQIGFGESLELLPSPLAFPQVDLFIQWVYVIDLDREELRVENSSYRWSYKLNEPPREAFFCVTDDDKGDKGESNEGDKADKNTGASDTRTGEDSEQGIKDGSKKSGQEIKDGSKDSDREIKDKSTDSDEGENLLAQLSSLQLSDDEFSQLHLEYVVPKTTIDEQYPMRTHQLLGLFLFRLLAKTYQVVLVGHVLNCESQDFIYREFAFAIISLAAGEFELLERRSFSVWSEDGISTYESDGSRTLLPAFGRGIHKRHVEAGSAPSTTVYWFENVLVSLDEGAETPEGLKAAITKVIQFARNSGRRSFHGLIFCLQEVVLIRVQSTGVVEFTDYYPLLDWTVLRGNMDHTHLSGAGFIAMTYLFNAALGPSQANSGPLPDEIYYQIMDQADWRTYRACAQVSSSLHRYAKSRIRLGNLVITGLKPHGSEDDDNCATFSFKSFDSTDQTETEWVISAVKKNLYLGYLPRPKTKADVSEWHLVVGDGDRSSLLTSLKFQLRKTPSPTEHSDKGPAGSS